MDKVLLQFLAVVEEGSISGAAVRLSVTQPTLTFNLKKLEQSLNVRLFERSSRGIKLNAYGETLYEHASIMRRLHENALDTIERQRLQLADNLSIGSGYSWWPLILKKLVLDYTKKKPQASINVLLGSNLRCMDQLLAGDIALFVGHKIDDLSKAVTVDFHALGYVQDSFFVREGHRLLVRPVTQEEVAQYPSVLAFPPDARQQRLLFEHENHDVSQRQPDYVGRAFTSNSIDACMEYVVATDAVLRHTNLMAPTFRQKGIAMVEMRPGEEQPLRLLGIYVLPERKRDPRVKSFIASIAALAETIVKPLTA